MSSASAHGNPKTDKRTAGASDLSREKIQQLLAALGSGPKDDSAETDAVEYNWREPHHFSSIQRKKLEDLANMAAAALADKFTTLCHRDLNATITSITEHFSSELIEQFAKSEQKDYHLAFGAGKEHACGFISVPPQTAVTWIIQLLGDSQAEKDSNRNLSQLEESLLSDTTRGIVEALSSSFHGFDFQPAETIVRGHPPVELQGTEELCKITFCLEKTDSEKRDKVGEAHISIFSNTLERVIGKAGQAADRFPAEDISKAITDHLQEMSVSVTAQLDSAVLSFEDIMNLEVDDILLFDRRIDVPIELTIQGQPIFCGRPAKSAGRYALVISEKAKGNGSKS